MISRCWFFDMIHSSRQAATSGPAIIPMQPIAIRTDPVDVSLVPSRMSAPAMHKRIETTKVLAVIFIIISWSDASHHSQDTGSTGGCLVSACDGRS